MAKNIKKEQAEKLLSDVGSGVVFFLHSGGVLKSMSELHQALKAMPKETFCFHVTKERNDFANWIRDIIGDVDLAKSLTRIRTKGTAVKKIGDRIKALEKAAQKDTKENSKKKK